MKRLILSAALAAGAVAVGMSPANPAAAGSCNVSRSTYIVQTVCYGSGPVRTRAVALCANGTVRYGSYVWDGQYSTASCAWSTTVGGYAQYMG